MEDAVSGVLSSETGSDARSLGISSVQSVPSWSGLRTQPSRLQKIRRGPLPNTGSPPPTHVNEFVSEDSASDVTSTWTVSLRVSVVAKMVY